MQGFIELVPSVPLQSRHRAVGQTSFLAYPPIHFFFLFVTRSSSLDGRRGEDFHIFFCGNPATPSLRDPRLASQYFSSGFYFFKMNALLSTLT